MCGHGRHDLIQQRAVAGYQLLDIRRQRSGLSAGRRPAEDRMRVAGRFRRVDEGLQELDELAGHVLDRRLIEEIGVEYPIQFNGSSCLPGIEIELVLGRRRQNVGVLGNSAVRQREADILVVLQDKP
ncbi:hypothetical protein D3C71_1110960 [compost metagenome]